MKTVVVVLLAGLMSVGVALALLGHLSAVHLLLIPGMLLLAIVWERSKYLRHPTPGSKLVETGECFEDPETGRRMRVKENTETGERFYEEDNNT